MLDDEFQMHHSAELFFSEQNHILHVTSYFYCPEDHVGPSVFNETKGELTALC